MGDIVRAFEIPLGLSLANSTAIFTGSLAPDSNSEVAPQGSIYLRTNGEVWLKYGSANSAWSKLQKHAYVTTSDPLTTNDGVDTASIGRPFEVGDLWANTSNDKAFICLDSTTSSAIWIEITVRFPTYSFFADQMDSPNSAWAVSAIAKTQKNPADVAIDVRAYDDTTEEGAGAIFKTPIGATNIIISLVSGAKTGHTTNKHVVPKLYAREIVDDSSIESWSAGTDMTTIVMGNGTESFQYDTQTIAFSTLGLVEGRVTQLELTRNAGSGSDNLVDDWFLLLMQAGFS